MVRVSAPDGCAETLAIGPSTTRDTVPVAQNIYDDERFFTGYSALPRSVDGLVAAPEWPQLRRMVGDVEGRRVVDLGCGFGWFCRWAADAGATEVLGIDISERMLAQAAVDTTQANVTYRRADLDHLALPDDTVDIAYSSLTLHYLADLPRLLACVHRALAPGGRFVCSIEHPVYTAPSTPGFVETADGTVTWALDGYFREGPRTTDWLAPGVVKQHRTVGTYVGALTAAGFRLTDLVEWGPSADDLAAHPDWRHEVQRPAFLLIGAVSVR